MTHPPTIAFDPRRKARSLYWRGWPVVQISEELSLARTTVQSWKDRDRWDEAPALKKVEDAVECRLSILIDKEKKTGQDFKEIDLLGRLVERTARVRRYESEGGHEGHLNEKVANRNAKPKVEKLKNLIDFESLQKLKAAFLTKCFSYQETWWDSSCLRTRFLLKSRQIGATYHFAHERLIRGLETGNNQFFISASRYQANYFRQYIVDFVFAELGLQLKGEKLVINRTDADGLPLSPVEFHFLGTNYRTAQGGHGDVVIDEAFWIYGFEQIYKVASAIASHKIYTKTIFSTPSTINHEAYAMWSGERYNKRRSKEARIKIDIGHEALKAGRLGADGIWRNIVTLFDAEAGGCDLFDIDELKIEYGVDEFNNLFGCEFIDDSQSSFPMAMIGPCLVDAWEAWRDDFKPFAARPYAGKVWIGYDPSESADGDNASLVVVAPPQGKCKKFRVLEKHQFKGKDFEAQDREIKRIASRYDVEEIVIDLTGMGVAVWQLVSKWFPTARGLRYTAELKSQMVLKAKNVFSNKRIEFDLSWHDLAAALMSIHPQLTKGQKQLTYVARRSAATGHGDLAWALLHALFCEPLDGQEAGAVSTVEFFDDE